MSGRPEGNLINAVQYVSNAITALRDFDDPDRNGTATLWLCRALIRLQKTSLQPALLPKIEISSSPPGQSWRTSWRVYKNEALHCRAAPVTTLFSRASLSGPDGRGPLRPSRARMRSPGLALGYAQ